MTDNSSIIQANAEAIAHFRQAVAGGKHWFIALLESISLWGSPEENFNGRFYRYLIDGEAFDWMLLAERLCGAVEGMIPENEVESFLFQGKPPVHLTTREFENLIGRTKYRLYLNYFYGVTVEDALMQAVLEEIRKERHCLGFGKKLVDIDEAYQRIYDNPSGQLLKQFRQEKKYRQLRSISLTEMKEFTYWLFKYRVKHAEKARVASDTKKALDYLKRQARATALFSALPPERPNSLNLLRFIC